MIDINIYRLRIGVFQMPCAKRSKFSIDDSKYKIHSYKLGLSLFQWLLLLLVFYTSLCESEHLSERKVSLRCRLSQKLTNKIYTLSAMKTDVNFYARYTYGNRKNRGVKLCHWNAGNAFLKNKMYSIENVVDRFSPHILGISEANLLKCHDKDEVQIPNYELFTSLTMDNPSLEYSRVVVISTHLS